MHSLIDGCGPRGREVSVFKTIDSIEFRRRPLAYKHTWDGGAERFGEVGDHVVMSAHYDVLIGVDGGGRQLNGEFAVILVPVTVFDFQLQALR
jgi:hypothetical protein